MSDIPPLDSTHGTNPGPMPEVDLRTAYWHQHDFYADPAVRTEDPDRDRSALAMRLAVMLTPLDPALPRHELGGIDASWTFFAGAPSRPVGSDLAWPRDDKTGAPLIHVLQVDLRGVRKDQGEGELAETGLPTTGLLQFFHDGLTYGDDSEATPGGAPSGAGRGGVGAWTVRWVPRPDETSGHDPDPGDWEATPIPDEPADWDGPGPYAAPVALAHEIAPAVPSLAGLGPDLGFSFEVAQHYGRIVDWMDEHPYDRNLGRRSEHVNPSGPWDAGYEPLPAPSRLLGFSAVPANEDYDRLVREHLPLEPGDEHLLLADINPGQFDEADVDWFHGGRHVEFWIRRSDLDARRFAAAWALIRTDH